MTGRVYQITAAVIRQGDEILLVQQQGPADPAPTWALPGGRVEPGEELLAALRREIREETGLRVQQVGPLLYTTQVDDSTTGRRVIASIFEVNDWEGPLEAADPDDFILDLCFLGVEEAVERLTELPWRQMKEPAIAYLKGEAVVGSVWRYRQTVDEQVELISGPDPY